MDKTADLKRIIRNRQVVEEGQIQAGAPSPKRIIKNIQVGQYELVKGEDQSIQKDQEETPADSEQIQEGIENQIEAGQQIKQEPQPSVEDMQKKWEETLTIEKQEAYKSGFHEGKEEGIRIGQDTVRDAKESFRSLCQNFPKEKERFFRDVEKAAVRLAYAIAEKIIDRKIQEDEDITKRTMQRALQYISEKDQIVIDVSRQDYDQIESLREEIALDIKFELNDGVQRGECIIHTPSGFIDASIKSQLQEIEKVLSEEM